MGRSSFTTAKTTATRSKFDEIWWNKPHADLIVDDATHKHTDWPSTVEAIKQRITKGPRGPENP